MCFMRKNQRGRKAPLGPTQRLALILAAGVGRILGSEKCYVRVEDLQGLLDERRSLLALLEEMRQALREELAR